MNKSGKMPKKRRENAKSMTTDIFTKRVAFLSNSADEIIAKNFRNLAKNVEFKRIISAIIKLKWCGVKQRNRQEGSRWRFYKQDEFLTKLCKKIIA